MYHINSLGVIFVQSLIVSDSLWPHRLQHARLHCLSPSPRICSNWCHTTIWSSVISFSFCLLSFPASGPFPKIWLFPSGGQSIGASTSSSVLSMNIRDRFSLGVTDLISLQSEGLSRAPQFESNNSVFNPLYGPTLTSLYDYWTNHGFDHTDLYWQCLCFLIHCLGLSELFSKEQSSFDFMAAVTICSDFGAEENKVFHWFYCYTICMPWSDGTGCHDLSILNVEF